MDYKTIEDNIILGLGLSYALIRLLTYYTYIRMFKNIKKLLNGLDNISPEKRPKLTPHLSFRIEAGHLILRVSFLNPTPFEKQVAEAAILKWVKSASFVIRIFKKIDVKVGIDYVEIWMDI